MIPVLFESGDLLALSKPEGLSAIPERDLKAPNLLRQLEMETGKKLFVVHRIDKEVSGVIVFAKNETAHRILSLAFEHRRVKKVYTALVTGRVERERGVIDRPLRIFGSGRTAVDEKNGKPSRTEYRVVERFAHATLLSVHPLTGRHHQIRAHFYHIGHPVAGDSKYGDASVQAGFPRLMLHASLLEFDALDGKRVTVEAPVPEGFGAVIEREKGRAGGGV